MCVKEQLSDGRKEGESVGVHVDDALGVGGNEPGVSLKEVVSEKERDGVRLSVPAPVLERVRVDVVDKEDAERLKVLADSEADPGEKLTVRDGRGDWESLAVTLQLSVSVVLAVRLLDHVSLPSGEPVAVGETVGEGLKVGLKAGLPVSLWLRVTVETVGVWKERVGVVERLCVPVCDEVSEGRPVALSETDGVLLWLRLTEVEQEADHVGEVVTETLQEGVAEPTEGEAVELRLRLELLLGVGDHESDGTQEADRVGDAVSLGDQVSLGRREQEPVPVWLKVQVMDGLKLREGIRVADCVPVRLGPVLDSPSLPVRDKVGDLEPDRDAEAVGLKVGEGLKLGENPRVWVLVPVPVSENSGDPVTDLVQVGVWLGVSVRAVGDGRWVGLGVRDSGEAVAESECGEGEGESVPVGDREKVPVRDNDGVEGVTDLVEVKPLQDCVLLGVSEGLWMGVGVPEPVGVRDRVPEHEEVGAPVGVWLCEKDQLEV